MDAEGEKKETQVSFRKLLLTRCQEEFEKDKSEEQWREELAKAVQEAKSVGSTCLDKKALNRSCYAYSFCHFSFFFYSLQKRRSSELSSRRRSTR